MPAAFKTVRLNRKFVETAALEGEQLNRSAGSQIEHWAQLGRRFESLSSTTVARIKEVLAGSLAINDLAPDEQRMALEIAGQRYSAPNAAVDAVYAALPTTAGATARRRAEDAVAAAE